MATNDAVIVLAIVAALALFGLVVVTLRRRVTTPHAAASEFVFSSPQDTNRQQFTLQVAGLIKGATGLETHLSPQGSYPYLDIVVLRGMRCVGVVSVVPPGWGSPASGYIRAIADARAKKGAKTAYVVTGASFTDKEKRQAAQAGVTLLDGGALKRIQRKVEVGAYAKKPQPPPELTPAEAKRWQHPKPASRIAAVTEVDPLAATQERRFKLPPWVEFR